MILADTSVWADHFRKGDAVLGSLLGESRVAIHPFIIGELALGNLRHWQDTVAALGELPQAPVVSEPDLLDFVAAERLMGSGIGFVDAHLLASASGTDGLRLWTRDKRLAAKAASLDLDWAQAAA